MGLPECKITAILEPATPPKIAINDQILNVPFYSVNYRASADDFPLIELGIIASDRVVMEGTARVDLSKETKDLLRSLGWKEPSND